MKKLLSIAHVAIMLFLCFITSNLLAQSSGIVSSGGAFLNKIVSHSSIQTGANITYTIQFSIPAGSTNIAITDLLPSNLEFVQLVSSPTCGVPVITQPASGAMGGLVKYELASVPTSCSGSFQIIARFKAGTTCNGTTASNNACMGGQSGNGGGIDMCTKAISTTAIATNPWSVRVETINPFITGTTPCNNLVTKDTVDYKVRVAKTASTYGVLDLVNGIVTVPFTSGKILSIVPVSGGTPVGGSAVGIGSSTLSWYGLNLSANMSSNQAELVNVRVYYPSMASAISYPTTATLTGSLGSSATPCQPSLNASSTTCVIKGTPIINPPNPKAVLYKEVKVFGNSVGCTGYYDVYVRNEGNANAGTFSINDIMPAGITATKISILNASLAAPVTLSVNSIQVLMGITNTSSNYSTLPINSVSMAQTGSLAPGQLVKIRIDFMITAATPTSIANTATVTSGAVLPTSRTVSFGVQDPTPKACTYKFICNPKPNYIYKQGDIVRYRLRVQNIGTANMVGARITDQLSDNLTYVGNPSYYTSTSNNPTCVAPNTNTWLPAAPTSAHSGQALIWYLPTIPYDCQSVTGASCGYTTPNAPFYFIDFDVKIRDTSGLGSVANHFIVSVNSTILSTSNSAYITVVGAPAFSLEKQVSTNNGSTYATAGTTSNGGTINYKLQVKNTGSASFKNITIIDLLPMNNGTSDNFILNRPASRNSGADVYYNSMVTSTPFLPTSTKFSPGSNLCVPELNYTPLSPCTSAVWGTSIGNGNNVKLDFGVNYLPVGNILAYNFKAIAKGDPQKSACNTFAAIASSVLVVNGNNTTFPMMPVESNKSCVTIQELCVAAIKGGTLCVGSETTLEAYFVTPCNGAATYLWSANAANATTPTVSIGSAGTYTCTVTCVETGCTAVASTTIVALPPPVISLGSQIIKCDGVSSVVSIDIDVTGGNPAYTYLWSNGVTTQNLSSVESVSASYCVTVTDAKGCKATKCFGCMNPCSSNVVVLSPRNSNNQSDEKTESKNSTSSTGFKIFPNPTKDEVTIQLNGDDTDASEIILTNTLGDIIERKKLTSNNMKLNIERIPNGLYIISFIKDGTLIASEKLIKQ